MSRKPDRTRSLKGTGKSARNPVKGRSRRKASQAPDCPVVGIGASAGGLEAFTAVLESLPADTGMSFVFISHLDPTHESILTSLLARMTRMPVLEAEHGMRLEPDHLYVIPRNARMSMDRCVLSLSRRPPAPAENLPIDYFMKSLAQDRRHKSIGVILSGTASDGTIGLTAIKNAGGVTLAQEPGTAKYDGMPRSAIKAQVVDFVLPPKDISTTLAQLARHPESIAGGAARLRDSEPPKPGMEGIFDLLRRKTGADFSQYKEATVRRRVNRRMALGKTATLADYVRLLRKEPSEVDALYEDLLIKVTEFFRDPKTFERLRTAILPSMLKHKSPKEPFRVWVPGCSTGEEAYSIAMLLLEVEDQLRRHNPIQIFGTDLSERSIAVARRGVYPASVANSVSPARRRRFFVEAGSEYRIVKQLRDACVFARQDITTDPPFSRVDLVSCRNVLIYMGKTLQETILPIFHYALKPDGCLLLGKAETLDTFADLFTAVDRKHRIYRRKAGPAQQLQAFGNRSAQSAPSPPARAAGAEPPQVKSDARSIREEAERLLMARNAPAGVVINEEMEVLEILGDTHPSLQLSSGTANLSILRLVQRDLVEQLSAAIDLARRTAAPVRRKGLSVKGGHGGPEGIYLEVVPMTGGSGESHPLLVLLETVVSPPADPRDAGGGDGRLTTQLKSELADSQEHVRLLMDVRQATEEELKSANEELMTSMEELQSANEELQTSREELESTNEELTTANEQLAVRNRDLSEIGNDLSNLVTSVDVPIVMLTGDLRLRRSTAAADKVMGLTSADIGRRISEIRHGFRFPGLEEEAAEVLKTLGTREIEVQDRSSVWYLARLRPYRTEDNRIDGLVLALHEIDRLKHSGLRAESSLRESKEELRRSRGELRRLTERLINSQEEERKRVARELHDELSQRLAALQLESADLAQMAAKISPPLREGYLDHQKHLADSAEEVRRLAHDLHPSVLVLGLRAAMGSFCNEFSRREGIDVEFACEKEPASLSEEAALCLYRVTQEALRNVSKHSGARSVRVGLRIAADGLHLSIRDRGQGFDVDASGSGLGIVSMKERLRLVDGTCHVRSSPQNGTEIAAWVPLPGAVHARRRSRARPKTSQRPVKPSGRRRGRASRSQRTLHP